MDTTISISSPQQPPVNLGPRNPLIDLLLKMPPGERIGKIARDTVFGIAIDQPDDDDLCGIARHIDQKPPFYISPGDLDKIAGGATLEDMRLDLRDGFNGILGAIEWWKEISYWLLGRTDEGRYDLIPEPAFAHHPAALLKLLNDTLTAYTAAWQEECYFTADWLDRGEATLELLKRYRLFTRYVCAFAQEAWPKVAAERLLQEA